MPFDAHFTPAQRAYEKRLNEVAGAWDMDDSYVAGYIAEISKSLSLHILNRFLILTAFTDPNGEVYGIFSELQ
jgi:hypothetical protein